MAAKFLHFLKRIINKNLDVESKILFKNSSWVFISNFVVSLCMFIKSIILGRTLGAETYGIFLLIVAFVMAIQEFINLNVGTALVKFGADYLAEDSHKKFTAFVKFCFLITALAAVLSVIFVGILTVFTYDIFIKKPGLGIYILVYATAQCLSFFDGISSSLLRLFYKFRLNSLIRLLSAIFEILIIIFVVRFFSLELSSLLVAVIAAMVLRFVAINGFAFLELRDELLHNFKTKVSDIKSDFKRIFSFILFNSASRTLKSLTSNGDVLILGALSGATPVGYYGIAKKLAFFVLRLTDPMRDAVYPQLANLIANRRYSDVKKLIVKITKIIAVPLAISFLVVLLIKDWIIITVYGKEFQPASNPFIYLFFSAGISALFFWSMAIIFSMGKVNLRLVVNIISLLFGGVLAYILAPPYQASGVAVAFLVSEVIKQSSFLYIIKKSL